MNLLMAAGLLLFGGPLPAQADGSVPIERLLEQLRSGHPRSVTGRPSD
jgi:hypothetical protein